MTFRSRDIEVKRLLFRHCFNTQLFSIIIKSLSENLYSVIFYRIVTLYPSFVSSFLHFGLIKGCPTLGKNFVKSKNVFFVNKKRTSNNGDLVQGFSECSYEKTY